MKLEEQVCSLELAKRLKELDIRQESLWYWHGNLKPEIIHTHYFSSIDNLTCSAFTVAELGEMLPDTAYTQRILKDEWECIYLEDYDYFSAETEANARAKMLIYLIENGWIDNDSTT